MSNPVAPSAAPAAPSSAPTSTPNAAPKNVSASAPKAPTPVSKPPAGQQPTGDVPVADLVNKATGNAPEAQTTEEIKEEIRRHKLKINGKEQEFDEPEVIRRAQLASAADEKFREAADMRKQAEQFFDLLINNPKELLLHPELRDQIKFREIAEEYLAGEIKREMLPPEQRELEDLREFKRQQEEASQQAEQSKQTTAQKQAQAQAEQRAASEYDQKITAVLQETNLPKTPYTVKRVAELMYGALQKGYDLDVQTAVDMVREGYMTDLQSLVGGLDGDHLIGALGPDIIKKLRKHDLAAIKKKLTPDQGAAPAAAPSAPRAPRQVEESQGLRPDEWKKELRRKAGL